MTAGKYVIGRLKLQGQSIPANGRFAEHDGISDYSENRDSGFGKTQLNRIPTRERNLFCLAGTGPGVLTLNSRLCKNPLQAYQKRINSKTGKHPSKSKLVKKGIQNAFKKIGNKTWRRLRPTLYPDPARMAGFTRGSGLGML